MVGSFCALCLVLLLLLAPGVICIAGGTGSQLSMGSPQSGQIDIEVVVDAFNQAKVSRQLGFSFKCNNPDSSQPVISFYVNQAYSVCVETEGFLRRVSAGISVDWESYTGSAGVNIYDDKHNLVYFIDNDGIFHIVSRYMI